ncbi:MAG: hypothetical protein AAGI34_05185 [Pseudomonadota bacterium]
MTPTRDETPDRSETHLPDSASPDTALEDTLESARRIFADVCVFLEREIQRCYRVEVDPEDPEEASRIRLLHDLIKQSQAALRTVLEVRLKLGRSGEAERERLIDLETARAEILDRLARLDP